MAYWEALAHLKGLMNGGKIIHMLLYKVCYIILIWPIFLLYCVLWPWPKKERMAVFYSRVLPDKFLKLD